MNINKTKLETNLLNLSKDIKGLLSKYGDVLKISESDLKNKNPDELFLIRQNEEMIKELFGMYHHLDYLNKKINMIGNISITGTGKVYLKDYEYYFKEGQIIEFLGFDVLTEKEMWMVSVLAKNKEKGEYFIFNYPNIKLDGLKVRVRNM